MQNQKSGVKFRIVDTPKCSCGDCDCDGGEISGSHVVLTKAGRYLGEVTAQSNEEAAINFLSREEKGDYDGPIVVLEASILEDNMYAYQVNVERL